VMAKSRDNKRYRPQLTELQGLCTLENNVSKIPKEFLEATAYDGSVQDLAQGATNERAVQHQAGLIQALRDWVRNPFDLIPSRMG
jgi:hypothetical protein